PFEYDLATAGQCSWAATGISYAWRCPAEIQEAVDNESKIDRGSKNLDLLIDDGRKKAREFLDPRARAVKQEPAPKAGHSTGATAPCPDSSSAPARAATDCDNGPCGAPRPRGYVILLNYCAYFMSTSSALSLGWSRQSSISLSVASASFDTSMTFCPFLPAI